MPEGPELCINSGFVNHVCKGRLFRGKVIKSAVSKCCDIDFSSEAYSISSEARGKELALTLQCTVNRLNRLRLVFRFGMSGKFRFGPASELPKHAHLQFIACDNGGEGELESPNVLSFVDARRFGTWRVMPSGWGEDRGPDPILEYDAFRRQILESVEDTVFNKPICEVMLNQKYFNGIGNYLRAEILFRANIPPFTCARNVLEPLCSQRDGQDKKKEDFLWLCHKVPSEVVELKKKLGKIEHMAVTQEDYLAFCQWLQCYEKPGMRNLKDHNGRTVWFKSEAGPMTPKIQRSRKRKGSGQAPGKVTSKQEADLGREGAVPVKGEPEVKEEAVTAAMGEEEQSKDTGFEKPVKQQRKRRRKSPPAAEHVETVMPPQKKPRGSGKSGAPSAETTATPLDSSPPVNPNTPPRTKRMRPSPTVVPTLVPTRRSTRIKNARQKV